VPGKDPTTDQPIDYYTLKAIIHDWGDAEAIKILKNLRAAVNDKDRVMFIEVNKGIDDSWEGIRRMIDVTMMLYVGMERDKAQWKKLFEQTGFKLIGILPSAGLFSVVEAEPI
jgi:hypothetical protein